MKNQDVFQKIEDSIDSLKINESEKKALYEGVLRLKNQKINLMITGATGCGKSSTINAMFNSGVAKVGTGVDPETMDIQKYELDNLVLKIMGDRPRFSSLGKGPVQLFAK